MNYRGTIIIDAERRRGQPTIRGLRITVYDVLQYLASGMLETQLLEDFPEFTHADALACFAVAADPGRRTAIIEL